MRIVKRMAILLTIMILWCTTFSSVSATSLLDLQDDFIYEEYECKILDDDTIAIVKYLGTNNEKKEEVIPSSINGKNVTTLCKWAFYGVKLASLTIPASIIRMEKNPFTYANIINFYIASDNPVFILENDAIYDVQEKRLVSLSYETKLKQFKIMDGTRIIGDDAIGLNNVEEITIPDSVVEIDEGAFSGCEVKNLVIPDSVKSIGKSAFCCCNELQSIKLSGRIQVIEESLFEECWNLKKIEIPEGVTQINENAFSRCRKLETVVLPDSLNEISGNPFSFCGDLDSIVLSPEHPLFAFADGVLFGKNDMRIIFYSESKPQERYKIPKGITIIGKYAFSGANLCEIVIPDTVNTIEEGAFSWCQSLSSIVIPEGVTSIEEEAFSNCENLKSVKLPDSLILIGDKAFLETNLSYFIRKYTKDNITPYKT